MPITRLNEIAIEKKLINALKAKKYNNFFYNSANTRFISFKREMLEEFDNHEVTKELQQDISKEGSELIDHGNLISFLGFPEGSNPAGELREYLNEEIKLDKNAKIRETKNKIYYDFKISTPSLNQIENDERFACPDNWRSTSWINIIENGVSNAVYYVYAKYDNVANIFREKGSRSGWGLQRKDKGGNSQPRSAGGSFTPKKYISEILQNFIGKFK